MYLVSGIKFSVPALNYIYTFRPHEIALLSIHFHQRFRTGNNNLGIQVLQSSTHLSKCSLYYCVYLSFRIWINLSYLFVKVYVAYFRNKIFDGYANLFSKTQGFHFPNAEDFHGEVKK